MQTISVQNLRILEGEAIAAGATEHMLIQRAAQGAWHVIKSFLGVSSRRNHTRCAIFLAGKGNNGADAVEIARLAAAEHFFDRTMLFYALPPQGPIPDAICRPLKEFTDFPISENTLIVDGLLGIGAHGALRQPLKNTIEKVNKSNVPVIALDLPSGIDGNSGIGSEAVTADLTITFGRPKTGLFLADGRIKSGRIEIVDIGMGDRDFPGDGIDTVFARDAAQLLPRLYSDTHKNMMGTVFVIGGSRRYRNAPVLSALAALRSGAGKVFASFGAPPTAAIPAALIATDDFSMEEVHADAVLVGPGMGLAEEARQRFAAILSPERTEKLVIDADALTLLALQPRVFTTRQVLLTPHPGEAERLRVGAGIEALSDRTALAKALAKAYNAAVILKGRQSIAALPDGRFAVNTSGTAALATAGSGDVLAGVVVSLLAQGMSRFDAAKLAMFLHGRAGELGPMRSLIADELPDRFGTVFEELTFFA